MKPVLLFISMVMASFAFGQDSWKVVLNKKQLLKANTESETVNSKKVNRSLFKQPSYLEITYTQKQVTAGWTRSLLFFDENDTELYRKDKVKGTMKISNSILLKLFSTKKNIKIYTISTPTDPSIAATVRIRRVHLCTIDLQ